MEFDEMKKIWDSQNNEPIYGFNEKALHNRILLKKKRVYRITNISELLAIVVYSGTGCFILGMNLYKQSGNIFIYILSVWMLGSAFYLLMSRIRRISRDHRFDRSMLADLTHAISVATYQVRISQLMRWNIIPVGLLSVLGIWDGPKSLWAALGSLFFFIITLYASGWEHRIYISRKRELENLLSKLENDKEDLQ